MPEVVRTVLLEELVVSLLHGVVPDGPVVFAEPRVPGDAARVPAVQGAHAVEAHVPVAVIQQVLDVGADVDVGVVGGDAVAVVGGAARAGRRCGVRYLVVVPDVI